jgi:DNA-binding beta-propeller fold protein YncE
MAIVMPAAHRRCPAFCVTMLMLALGTAGSSAALAAQATLGGAVESAGAGLAKYRVTLYATTPQDTARDATAASARAARNGRSRPQRLARTVTGTDGSFDMSFHAPGSEDSVLYLVAERQAVTLATVLGPPSLAPDRVIVNERTTVASGFALAQFIHETRIAGNHVGLRNAAAMLRNLVDIETGAVGTVLGTAPNGRETSTLRSFNSLANLLAACVDARRRCGELLGTARSLQGRRARNTLEAVAHIAVYPGQNVERLFAIAQDGPTPYAPALKTPPDAWTLALRFEGDGRINGPGNFAIDAEGSLWVTDNYEPGDRTQSVCAGRKLLRFQPNGAFFPGSPYVGGGLSGAGYGITADPDGHVWVGNFGFQAPACVGTPREARHNSVSAFAPDGTPLSPDIVGYTAGKISWPQGTVSDRQGTIWIANCGNNSVTVYPGGDPRSARNIDLGPLGMVRPFDIAIDRLGRAWVTGNGSDSVLVLDPNGRPVLSSPTAPRGIQKPLGIATDSRGNMWVASSGIVDVPCDNDARTLPLRETGGTVTLLEVEGRRIRHRTFAGGGLALPWGVAVDGNDNVWVSNFGGGRDEGGSLLSRVSQICGTRPATCPQGHATGDPISPRTGYTSDALERVTAVAVDPSGNLWATDNWKFAALPNNPGGEAIVAFVGLAAPIVTPLIGPPQPAD